ncbi:hypothetical protein J6590_031250 [Homalodisca vitripennis]|nr:hypothetical protein J6590_031250 [Homalodisca vitripennis]
MIAADVDRTESRAGCGQYINRGLRHLRFSVCLSGPVPITPKKFHGVILPLNELHSVTTVPLPHGMTDGIMMPVKVNNASSARGLSEPTCSSPDVARPDTREMTLD